MKIRNIYEELKDNAAHTCAVGAFNILNHLTARAVVRAAEAEQRPVILQTSVATVKAFTPEGLMEFLRPLADNSSVNVIIHLDHCKDPDYCKLCVDAGWDAVMFDGSALPLEENIRLCREIVSYAHARGVCVEGELGRIAGVEDDISIDEKDEFSATLEESLRFVHESGVDIFAPAVGTAHGLYKKEPNIRFELVRELKAAIDNPIVIHGGTGLDDDTFRRLIRCGGSKINISTAVKHAYLGGCKERIRLYPEKVDPIGFDRYVTEEVEKTAAAHIRLFSSCRT